jgi:hypothetical protein
MKAEGRISDEQVAHFEKQLRSQAMTAENARLRRERDEAKRKLDAIAEIERSMINREPEPADAPEPVRPEPP